MNIRPLLAQRPFLFEKEFLLDEVKIGFTGIAVDSSGIGELLKKLKADLILLNGMVRL